MIFGSFRIHLQCFSTCTKVLLLPPQKWKVFTRKQLAKLINQISWNFWLKFLFNFNKKIPKNLKKSQKFKKFPFSWSKNKVFSHKNNSKDWKKKKKQTKRSWTVKHYGKLSLHRCGGTGRPVSLSLSLRLLETQKRTTTKNKKAPIHDNSISHLKLIRLRHRKRENCPFCWLQKPGAARHNCLKLSFRAVQIFIDGFFFFVSFSCLSLSWMCWLNFGVHWQSRGLN